MTATSKAAKSKKSASSDAIVMLMDDHKRVKALFKQYEKSKENATSEEKQALVTQVCNELKVHAQLEEEIFYPAAREALDDEDLLDEAEVEHASAKDLIAQLDAASPEDDLYDAKVKVLAEYVDHHVKEEEDEMFPKAKKSELDTAGLGAEMKARKSEIVRELGLEAMDDESEGDFPAIPRKKVTATQGEKASRH